MTRKKIALAFLLAAAVMFYFAVSGGTQKLPQELTEGTDEAPPDFDVEAIPGQPIKREAVSNPSALIELTPSEYTSSDLSLGTLLDVDNNPVNDWKLELRSRKESSSTSSFSNLHGVFRLPAFPPPWECVIEDPNANTAFRVQIEAKDLDGDSLVLRLPLMSDLAIKVLDPSGVELKDATVTLKGSSDTLSTENLGVFNPIKGLSGWARTFVTDENGTAVAHNLTEHYSSALVLAKGFESKVSIYSPGQTELTVQLDLAPTISFLVIAEESGEPISGAEVFGKKARRFTDHPASATSNSWNSGSSDSRGVAQIVVKGRGDWFTVICRAKGRALLGVTFLLSEAPAGITLSLSSAESLVVSLVDDIGNPVPDIYVTLVEEASLEEGRIPIQGLLDMFQAKASITNSQGIVNFSEVPQMEFRVDAKHILEQLHRISKPEQLLASGHGFPGENPVVLIIGDRVAGDNTLVLLLHSASGETVSSEGLLVQLSSKSVSGPWFRSEMNAIPSPSNSGSRILGIPFEPVEACIRSVDYFFSNLSLVKTAAGEFQLKATVHAAKSFKLNILDSKGNPFANEEVVFRFPAVEGLGDNPLKLNGASVFQTDKKGILATPPLPNKRIRIESRWDPAVYAFLELSNELGAVVEVIMKK